MEIYEIENPFWLSDIFIFEYIDKVGYCYVKVNYQDKIEEIGINISKRMHNQSIANILLKAKKATNNHKSIFLMFIQETQSKECIILIFILRRVNND